MKTLYPVSEETYAKIGKAYLICSEYPEVFEDVTFKKFCSMFVDVIDDDEDEHEVRVIAHAKEMYKVLREIHNLCEQEDWDEVVEDEMSEVLKAIDGEEAE